MTTEGRDAPEAPLRRRARGGDLAPAGAWRRSAPVRRGVLLALTTLDVLTLIAVLADVGGVPRELLGLLFVAFVPGASIVGLLRLRDAALELAVVFAFGLSSLILVAQLVITLHAWHLFALEVALLVAFLVPLGVQLAQSASLRGWRR